MARDNLRKGCEKMKIIEKFFKKKKEEPRVAEQEKFLDPYDIEWLDFALGEIVDQFGTGEGSSRFYKDEKIIIKAPIEPGKKPEVRFLITGKWYPVYGEDWQSGKYKISRSGWFDYVEKKYMEIIWEKN